jgi:signal transduction histidine kinase
VSLAEKLRSEHLEIAREWIAEMKASGNEAARLERSALVDHMPEFLVALAHWVAGDEETARGGFDALAKGHALTRLGFGIALDSVAQEYAILRRVVLRRVLPGDLSDGDRSALVRLNQGMDRAVYDAIARYTAAREATRETFIGILGHDLRNPLAAVKLAVDRLIEVEHPGVQRHAAVIARAAARMQRMIADLLDFARGRLGGGFPVTPRDEDMGALCAAAIDEIGAGREGRSIELATHGDLRGRWDHDRVVQALSNLLANAIEHGGDPVRVVARADGQEHVITELSNQGAAIPDAIVRSMFDPFGARARASTGLGLGLYIVREIVLAHGGTIDVRCDAGPRVVFTIRWPRALRYP